MDKFRRPNAVRGWRVRQNTEVAARGTQIPGANTTTHHPEPTHVHDIATRMLQAAAELLYHRPATLVRVETVTIRLGRIDITRDVATFELSGGDGPQRCYAWTDPPGHDDHRVSHRVVMHGGSAGSPARALRSFLLVSPDLDQPGQDEQPTPPR